MISSAQLGRRCDRAEESTASMPILGHIVFPTWER
jgi:hypothetical protein